MPGLLRIAAVYCLISPLQRVIGLASPAHRHVAKIVTECPFLSGPSAVSSWGSQTRGALTEPPNALLPGSHP